MHIIIVSGYKISSSPSVSQQAPIKLHLISQETRMYEKMCFGI